MNPHTHQLRKSKEAGVALLIAIFMLLLVSAVAISLMMSSSTESSLASNYRSSTSAYYAALAGLEEGRGRLLSTNPNYFNNTVANFIPAAGLPIPPNPQVRYILNPLAGEVVAPTTAGNQYYDNEYANEFGVQASTLGAAAQTIASVSNTGGSQGPMYKWVRISGASEQSVNLDVDNRALPLDNTTSLFYDPAHLNLAGASDPSLIVNAAPPSTAKQAYEVAALAVLPNGTKKLLEYVVAPASFNLNLDSPLTIPGTVGSFSGGSSANYTIDGHDGGGNPPAVPGCNPNSQGGPAVAVSNQSSGNTVEGGIPSNRVTNYTGTNCSYDGSSTSGCVGSATLPNSMGSPAALQQTLQTIAANSNVCLTSSQANANSAGCTNPTISAPGGTGYSFSQITGAMPGGSWPNAATNPQVVYVDGDLDISGNNPGSGILVVTGNLTYDGNSNWNGIILVIGEGTTTFNTNFNVNGGGNGQFNGAIFVATITHNGNGNILPTFGTSDFNVNGGGGSGIFYNSCWINNAQKPITYQVLSFKEISQ